MTLSPAVLSALLTACAPHVATSTQAALVATESGGDAWALHANDSGRSYAPHSYSEALSLGTRLLAENPRRGVDVGLAQINSRTFAAYHVSLADMLDPCRNLRVGAAVLAADYQRELTSMGNAPSQGRVQTALRRALSDYNSGSPTAAPEYVSSVITALHSDLVQKTLAIAQTTVPAIDPPMHVTSNAVLHGQHTQPHPHHPEPQPDSLFYSHPPPSVTADEGLVR